ncbi:unnamed protein product [Polarella glacialis]|uniref:catechol O-methyltransferase n=1 Tax=Polarella glacialis TaxID=89957 RepID=A0A813KMA6_POLGL|nr:unnamed protein product [Polarella glacialis]
MGAASARACGRCHGQLREGLKQAPPGLRGALRGRSAASTADRRPQGDQARAAGRPGADHLAAPAVKSSSIARGTPYSKELRLLAHVFENARAGDPISVCDAIEHFGEEVLNPAGQWLKVAGRHKATILEHAMREAPRGGSILEIGAYCGYSAIRMALALPGARIVTLEVDPAHVVIARNMVAFAGLAHMIDVWTGHSKDLLPRLPARYGGPEKFKLCGVFMDQKGSRYDEDLGLIERMGLLLPGAVVVADNVLKPGSPLFLWRLQNGGAYDNHVARVREFAMPAEDWMSVSVLRPEAAARFLRGAGLGGAAGVLLPNADHPHTPAGLVLRRSLCSSSGSRTESEPRPHAQEVLV